METDWRLVAFIKQLRKEHGNIGKNMLKPFVDAYAQELGITSLAESTIGKVIRRHHLTFEKKVYPQKQANKFKKLRVRRSPRVFQEFQDSNPTPIHTVQTDNGSEFLKSFHEYRTRSRSNTNLFTRKCQKLMDILNDLPELSKKSLFYEMMRFIMIK